jgi:23S rRNA pseudouridine1911/1915/1917 synthase
MGAHVVPGSLDGARVDKAVAVLGSLSRAEARAIVDAGSVTAAGRVLAAKERVSGGDVLDFETPKPTPRLVPEAVAFEVRYEDRHLVVVDKPAGLVVHPGAGRRQGTLAAGLVERYPEIEGVGDEGRWGIVHRLDRDTSGLLVVARTGEAHALLSEAIRRREIARGYVALVEGVFDVPRGTIDAPIAAHPAHPTRRIVAASGRPARTHYRVVGRWPGWNVSLLSVELETGRTHQIRVHLASIGHAVVGDRWYGRPGRVDAPRVFLHAARLGFVHPITGVEVAVESPLPPDLAGVVAALGPSS